MRLSKTFYVFILFVVLSLLSLYRHKNIPAYTFRSEIWADRAGYYIYLPSAFLYHYSTKEFPGNIDNRTGEGFNIKSGKVITKYTYGVALLQSPFYFLADFITSFSNNPRDGFSFFYQKAISIASVFYLVIGLYLLYLSLKIRSNYDSKILLITLSILFFGTNLYYYSIVETGMSHVYSFFLFSSVLYVLSKKNTVKYPYTFHIILSLLIFLILLIRPINGMILLIPLTWETSGIKQIYLTIQKNLKFQMISIWVLSFLVVFTPQFIYWKYAYGSFITYSYDNESFSNFLSPKFAEVLFSPHNGLFPYSMVFTGIIIGIVLLLKYKPWEGSMHLLIILFVIYITASWHDWTFGCGAGMRNMVEYYSILSFPLCFFINRIFSMKKFQVKLSALLFISLLVIVSFKVNYHYFGCYFGGTWNWLDYINTLTYPVKIM